MGRAARVLIGGVALLCLALAATPSAAATTAVTIEGTAFKPSTISVAVGDTVSWTNLDGGAHTVTSNTGVWESGTIRGGGGQFTRVFSTAGRFEYFCQLHAWMLGVVVVGGDGVRAAQTTAPITAAPSAFAARASIAAEPVAAAPSVALPDRAGQPSVNDGAPGPVFVALAGVLIVGLVGLAWVLVRGT